MSSASSNSNDPVICKTVIDYEEYIKLKKLESKERDFWRAKTEELKEKVVPSEPPSLPSSEDTIQTGSGLTDLALSTIKSALRSLYEEYQTELVKILTKVLEDKLNDFLSSYGKKVVPIKSKNQTGKGDLVEIPAGEVPPTESLDTNLLNIEKASTNTRQASQQQHEGDKEKILESIPSLFKKKANILLHHFYANPMSVSWDTAGNLFVTGTNIPGSNIYEIFPALYKNTDHSSLKGFYTLLTYILSSGLGHLIKQGKVKGLSRKRKLNLPPIDHGDKKWYKLAKMT